MTLRASVLKRLEHFTLDIALRCGRGELLAVVGPSGAGKTTLLRIIAGLERPDQGEVFFGESIWASTATDSFVASRHRGLALVFQNSPLFPHLNLAGNVAYAAKNKKSVPGLLERFGIAHLARAKPRAVSGGERQRAAFCQALAREPNLLLLDEPFSALDGATRESVRLELKAIQRERGIPVIHVTHDMAEAEYLADDILAIEQGLASKAWLDERRGTEKRRGNGAVRRIAA